MIVQWVPNGSFDFIMIFVQLAIDFYNYFSVHITEKSLQWLSNDFRVSIDFIMIFYPMISIDWLNTAQFKSLSFSNIDFNDISVTSTVDKYHDSDF